MSLPRVITVIGDIARDVNVHVDVPVPLGLVPAGDTPARIRMGLGGSATATAAWLAHVGHAVRLVGARGDDRAGTASLEELRHLRVEPQLDVIPGTPTGTVIVIVDPLGERTMLPDAGANAALSAAWCLSALTGEHLHVSAYPWFRHDSRRTIEAAIEGAHDQGMSVSIDLNSYSLVREHLDPLLALLARVDIVFANDEEWRALNERWAMPRECIVVVKMGAEGARWSAGGDTGTASAIPVRMVDSTGTGDAFAAGFLHAWVDGASVADSAVAGNQLAAVCATRVGPAPEFPD